MRRRRFLTAAPLLLPAWLARRAVADTPLAYPPVTPGYRIVLPGDHGAHPAFRIEWWYVTGALNAPRADVGFQLTFFRYRPGYAEQLRTPLAARQILFAHAALTWPGDRLQHSERSARANLGAHVSTSDCDVSIGSWRLWRESRESSEPHQAHHSPQRHGNSEYFRLRMQSQPFAFDFILKPTQAPMLQGEQGYSRKGAAPHQASYYLSWPQLQVTGTLIRHRQAQTVEGRAWFDHEWSTAMLADNAVGWDWLGINLDDGGALMAFRLRDSQGETVFADAAWRNASGRQQPFPAHQIRFTPLGHWLSPRSGAVYPVQLEIRLGDLILRTQPVLDDQELNTRRPTPVVYWEGLVHLVGSLRGRGYLELTGYTQRVPL